MSIYRGKNKREFSLASTLYDCISDNDYRGTLYMLNKGADPNLILPSPGLSAFHLAIGNESEEFAATVIKLILQYGGNPNIQSEEGLTPLHIAAAWGRFDIVKLLISCGANPEIQDHNWFSCYDYANQYKHTEIENFIRNDIITRAGFKNLEQSEEYILVLDKIIVNNGFAEGEYEVQADLKIDDCLQDLKLLPQTNLNEYVRNWCSKHAIDSQQTLRRQNSLDSESIKSLSVVSKHTMSPNLQFINTKNRTRRNKNVFENFTLNYEPSIKYLVKQSRKLEDAKKDCKRPSSSKESGIATLPETLDGDTSFSPLENVCDSIKQLNLNECVLTDNKDTSSDYFTCNEHTCSSTSVFNQYVVDNSLITEDKSEDAARLFLKNNYVSENEQTDFNESTETFYSVAEVYKYVDNQEGIILYEKRLLKTPQNLVNESIASTSSKLSSLPSNFNYDTDTLRQELTHCGFQPGPITRTTKRVYLKKLRYLQKCPTVQINEKVFSAELEKTLKNPNWCNDLTNYKELEQVVFNNFNSPDPNRRWREGINKSSFTYLLLDPRITNNLPVRSEKLSANETWQTFIASIFYVGKGKRSRPYSHLYDAVVYWKDGNKTNTNEKLQQIVSIWKDDYGVVCLHIFQNIIPVEAYTREAAMISALSVKNIKNLKMGDFYGTACTWTSRQQKMLGVYLLYKAMLIFLNEGERQLRPADIK